MILKTHAFSACVNGMCKLAFTLQFRTVIGEILVPDEGENDGGRGVCVRNPCPRAHLYFPDPAGTSAGRRHRLEGAAGTCHKV
jgi:hypothetical protein